MCLLALVCFTNIDGQSIQDARKLTDNEQYENASSIYQELISKNPNDVNLYYYYADNLLLCDNLDSARIMFFKGRTIDSTNTLIKIGNAKIFLDKIGVKESKLSSEQDLANNDLRNRYNEAVTNVKEAEALIDEVVLKSKDINVLIEAAEALIQYKNKIGFQSCFMKVYYNYYASLIRKL